MKAVLFDPPGRVEDLHLAEVPRPDPAAGELLVRNFATALNRADLLQRRGLYPPPAGASDILGLEFSGEVAEVGEGVDTFRRGDRVFGLCAGGAYAEFLCIDQRLAMAIPDTLSFDAAAAIPEAFLTAGECLFELARLRADETLLVHAGASGVGSAAIQLARRAGVRVAATVGSPEKASFCDELGVDRVIEYREQDFVTAVLGETEGRGVDVVLDFIGADYLERNLKALAIGGRLLLIGLLGGRKAELDLSTLLMRRLSILSTTMRGQSIEAKGAMTRRFHDTVLPAFESGELRPLIDEVYSLEDVRQAHARMEANENRGKIILRL